MCAGVIVRSYQTKQLGSIRGVLERLPWTGPVFLASVLALCAMPPFGLFRSEFAIVAGGIGAARTAPAAILVVLVTLAFLGLLGALVRPVLTTRPAGQEADVPATGDGARLGGWMVLPPLVGMVVLLVLGLHPPAELSQLLRGAAGQLSGTVS